MLLLKKSRKSSTGIAGITLVLSVIIVLLIPVTLLATNRRWELRKEAAKTPAPSESTEVATTDNGTPKYIPGEILVKFKSDPKISDIGKTTFPTINETLSEFENPILSELVPLKETGNPKVRGTKEKFGLNRIYKISLSKEKSRKLEQEFNEQLETVSLDKAPSLTTEGINGLDVTKLLVKKLLEDPNVEYAEINGLYYPTDTFPNDALFNQQWSLHNTSQTGGALDADIDAPEAWQGTIGNSQVIIAVLDSGVKYDHEDLEDNILKNAVGEVIGYDFANNDPYPTDGDSHGTHVAGTISATSDNGLGVSGICWSCKIMPIRFIGDYGFGTTEDAIRGIAFATENGARVINNSWGGGPYSQALQDTINAANEVGVLVIAASGNDNGDMKNSYPAALDNVVSVGSTDENDQRSWFSNYGLALDLSAPGERILSTFVPGYVLTAGCEDSDRDGYGLCGGTSMAAPHVSGVAALILSQNPTMTLAELKRKLLFGVDDKGDPSWDEYFGLGRVNAEKGVTPPPTPRMKTLITDPPASKVISYRTIPIKGYAFADDFASFEIEVGAGEDPISWQTAGLTLANAGAREVFGDKLADFDPQTLPHGLLTFKLTVFGTGGETEESRTTVNYMPERTVYVDDDNTSGIEDGTREHPFNTIQGGLDDANPLDTVKVLSGTYVGGVRIENNEITLSGESPWTTVISGEGVQNSFGIGKGASFDLLEGIVVENFTIEGFQRGIHMAGELKDTIIRNNIVKDIAIYEEIGYGIHIDHFNTNTRVVGNFVLGGKQGIFQNGFQNNGNSYESNYVAGASFAGLYIIHWGNNLLIRDNVFVNSQIAGIGISGEFPNSTIDKNHMEANHTGLFPGFFSAEGGAVITKNNLTDNTVYSVWVSPLDEGILWSKNGEGNYWSDYDEPSEGAFDNDNDGIADSPYQIAENHQDDFPFIKENGWQRSEFTLYPTKTSAGSEISIYGTQFGSFDEENKVILNHDGVNERELSIERWNETQIVAELPQEIMPGRYHVSLLIKGQGGDLPSETGLVLTVFHSPELVPECTPEILLPGDLDCDCDVDIADIMMVAAIWNTEEGDPGYNPEYDFREPYGRINITDIMYVAAKWNTRCP